jgi:pyruvate kinase
MPPYSYSKTKIICTLGPATQAVERIAELIQGGMDVARLNLSHGSHDEHLEMIRNVREAATSVGQEIGILLDLQGPKIRIGKMSDGTVTLEEGKEFVITTDDVDGDSGRVSTTYGNLTSDLKVGDKVLLDDGRIELRVDQVTPPEVRCVVICGGELSSHKGINLPGVHVTVPSLTPKDLDDLDFGIANEVDYIALSFVRSAADIAELRKAIIARVPSGRYLPVIAKIEKPDAVKNIDAIIAEADGIMIARGDLGVELSPEEVPILQKRIVRKCNEVGKPVVIATQMLESMIQSPTPTRAEASDVANAVLDGGDAVMLSGETSIGKYPLDAVKIMDRIVRRVEAEGVVLFRILDRPTGQVESRREALGRAACVLAEQMGAAAIVTITHSGNNARIVARYRPHIPIIAVTDRAKVVRRLKLVWGVRSLLVDKSDDNSDLAVGKIRDRMIHLGLLKEGDHVVVLAGQPLFAKGSTSFVRVEKV